MTRLIIVLVACYLLGSLPTSALVARWYRIDIRGKGSGNPGATNVLRVIGWRPALLVLLVDVAKGFLAAWWVAGFAANETAAWPPSSLTVAAGIAAVVGHIWPIFSGFRGGKGVATGGGVLLAADPWSFGIALSTFAVVVGATRLVSLASLSAAALLPILLTALRLTGAREVPVALIGYAFGLAALVAFAHRGNLAQLIAGTEPRIGRPD